MKNKIEYLDYTFSDVKIASGSMGQECSLPISSIGIDTLEIEVKCQDPSIINFVQNTPITYFHRSRQMGMFYVQSITRIGPERYTIYGISSVGRLDQRQHYGGIYNGENDCLGHLWQYPFYNQKLPCKDQALWLAPHSLCTREPRSSPFCRWSQSLH